MDHPSPGALRRAIRLKNAAIACCKPRPSCFTLLTAHDSTANTASIPEKSAKTSPPLRPVDMASKGLLSLLLPLSLLTTASCIQLCSAFQAPLNLRRRHHVNRQHSSSGAPTTSPRSSATSTPILLARNRPTIPGLNPARRLRGWFPRAGADSSRWGCGLGTELGSNASRRQGSQLQLSMAAAADGLSRAELSSGSSAAKSVNWPLWYVLPIAPYQRRKTLMEEVVPGKVGVWEALLVCLKSVQQYSCFRGCVGCDVVLVSGTVSGHV